MTRFVSTVWGFVFATAALAADGPVPKWEPLFLGVDGSSLTTSAPRPLAGYAVRIGLLADGLSFLATPPASDTARPKAETIGLKTTSFLAKYKLQVAINAAPYSPVLATEGQPQDVQGLHVSNGRRVSDWHNGLPALLITKENRARVAPAGATLGDVHTGVGGFQIVLKEGKVLEGKPDLHPRTAAGITADGKTMIWLVIDGRQKGYSEGVSTKEVGEWLKSLGCDSGINLDGGGTTTLVVEGTEGIPKILNRPIHGGKSGQERVSGSHLGLFAKPKP